MVRRDLRDGSKPWGAVVAVLVVVVAIAGWWLSTGSSPAPTVAPRAVPASVTASVDPVSGLPWVDQVDLPQEADYVLTEIRDGGPYRYRCCDDVVFRNDEGLLPTQRAGYYKEFTVTTPGASDRGPRRIVAGAGGELYYTADHYRSFGRIRR